MANLFEIAKEKGILSEKEKNKNAKTKMKKETPSFTMRRFNKENLEIDNKQVSNRYQTDNKQVSKKRGNRYQTDNKQITEISPKIETDNKQVTKQITKQITIGKQTDNKQVTKLGFESLVGNEKKLLLLIFNECLRTGSLTTSEMTLSFISDHLECSSGTAKVVIHRLIKKGFSWREKSKTGRGGWIKFGMKKNLYQDLRIRQTDNKQVTNRYQTDNKQVTEQITEQITKPHSSSYNFNLKKNTTTIVDNSLLEKCALIQIPSEVLQIGFKESHLKQIITDSSLNVDEIQESLNHYALDLRNGSVRAGFGKLNMIVGVLKKSNVYTSEAFIAEEQSMLAELSKRSELLNELKKKEKEIKMLKKYKAWKSGLSQSQINELVPPDNIIKEGGTLQDIKLQSYFETDNNEGEFL